MNDEELFYGERILPEKPIIMPNRFSRMSMHLGIWSVILSFLMPFIGIVLAVLAIIFGIKSNEGDGLPTGGKVGIIAGSVSVFIFILSISIAVVYLSDPEVSRQLMDQYRKMMT